MHNLMFERFNSNTTEAAYISPGHPSSPPVFNEFRFAWSLVLCPVCCRSLFVLFDHCISFLLRFTASVYPFGIFRLFSGLTLCFHPNPAFIWLSLIYLSLDNTTWQSLTAFRTGIRAYMFCNTVFQTYVRIITFQFLTQWMININTGCRVWNTCYKIKLCCNGYFSVPTNVINRRTHNIFQTLLSNNNSSNQIKQNKIIKTRNKIKQSKKMTK